jgi:uncharacterized membrane protein
MWKRVVLVRDEPGSILFAKTDCQPEPVVGITLELVAGFRSAGGASRPDVFVYTGHAAEPREEATLDIFRGALLVVATMTVGLMAGVFGLYANAIMPGLRKTDDRTFVGAFQSIDRAIINPLFMSTFVGALLSAGLAALVHIPDDVRSVLPWCVAAFVLYLFVFVSTIAVNVPLNDGIKAAGDPNDIDDLAAVRTRFNEGKWARWNVARAVLTLAAFGCLVWALVEHGRTT